MRLAAMHVDLLKENGLWPWFVRVQMPLFIQIPLWISLSFALRGQVWGTWHTLQLSAFLIIQPNNRKRIGSRYVTWTNC